MVKKLLNLFVTSLLGALTLFALVWFSVSTKALNSREEKARKEKLEKLKLAVSLHQFVDKTRDRKIPYVLYHQIKSDSTKPVRLIVFSHGYGKNYQKNYLGYTYLTKNLARKGYWVLSIQHELPNDPPLPFGTEIFKKRYPIWLGGMLSIQGTIAHFKKEHPAIEIASIDLIGHSNGGDMSVLTATLNPKEYRKVITLDNLRFPFPLRKYPEILTLRSIDKVADTGVIPTKAVLDSIGLKVIQLKKVGHNDMTDYAKSEQKKQILKYVYSFLKS